MNHCDLHPPSPFNQRLWLATVPVDLIIWSAQPDLNSDPKDDEVGSKARLNVGCLDGEEARKGV